MTTQSEEHFDETPKFSDGDALVPEEYRRQRTQVIYSEGYNPEKDDKETEDVIHIKTDFQKQKLMNSVNECLLFRTLDQEHRNLVINAMFQRYVKQNDVIIQQGEPGDNYYIIEEGVFDVFIDGRHISTYNNSGCFGELALMYNMPRAATVRASTDGILWALDRQTFRRIVLRGAFRKRKMYEQLIAKVPMFEELDTYEKVNVADALVPMYFKQGDIIIQQGDPADGMYFIESGAVNVCNFNKGENDSTIKQIEQGDYFGELALVTKKPRAFTIVAASEEVKCAFLDVNAFERLLGPCMEIMKRNIRRYEEQSSELTRFDKLKLSE